MMSEVRRHAQSGDQIELFNHTFVCTYKRTHMIYRRVHLSNEFDHKHV